LFFPSSFMPASEEKKSQALFTRLFIWRLDIVFIMGMTISIMMIHDMDTVRLIMYCFYTFFFYRVDSGFLLATVLIPLMYLFCVIHFYHIRVWGLFYRKRNKSDI
jgi:hypothetical protein